MDVGDDVSTLMSLSNFLLNLTIKRYFGEQKMKYLRQRTLSSHLLKAVIVSLAVLALLAALDGHLCCDSKCLLYDTKRRVIFSKRKP